MVANAGYERMGTLCKGAPALMEVRDDEAGKKHAPAIAHESGYETLACVSNNPSRSAAQIRSAYLLMISLLASRKSTNSPGASSSKARIMSALLASGR